MHFTKHIHLESNYDNIINGCIAQQSKAQEQLYYTMHATMIAICWRYANDVQQASQMYNNAMLKVFKNIKQYSYKGSFEGWVKRIVVNTCIDFIRTNKQFEFTSIDESNTYNALVAPEAYSHLEVKDIISLIHQLPKNTGLVFNLYVLDGYKHHEIGTILNISEGTSKWHLNEARRLLKIALQNIETNTQQHY
jgi:RNA polymerase sigma-70 factor, ECF subfamily